MVRAISNGNNESTSGVSADFTPVAATKMLPLLRMIVADLQSLSRTIELQRERLKEIDRLPQTIDQPDYREELSDIRGSLQEEEQKLDACLRELASLGVEVHLPFDGSIDFPAVINRRAVRLCWLPSDERVEYWHEIGQSSDQRQKIEANLFGGESVN